MNGVNNDYDIVGVFKKYIDKDVNIENLYLELASNGVINSFFEQMKNTEQNKEYHAEGNVWNHTKLVVDRLKSMQEFYSFSEKDRIELMIAAVFHDIGKIKTTKMIDGKLSSPHHAQKGEQMMRKFLWRNCNMAGSKELQCMRENICTLIRYHMRPYYIMDSDEAEASIFLIEISVRGELIDRFTIEKLCVLSMADSLGRICEDSKKSYEQVQLCMLMADDLECLNKPFCLQMSIQKELILVGEMLILIKHYMMIHGEQFTLYQPYQVQEKIRG